VTERTRRIARLALGLVVPHTAVVLVQRRRARRHRATLLVRRPAPAARASRAFDYDEAVALLVGRGIEEDVVRLGSIPRVTMAFAGEVVGRHSRPGPLRVLHVGNFLGLSLAALSDIAVRHDAQSVIVSVDPNLTHLEVEDPQAHVLALLAEFGLQRNNLVICGYSLEGSGDGDASEHTLNSLERLGQRFDLVLVDGNHDTAYLRRELEVIVRLLDDGALLMLDDVSHAYPEVRALFDALVDDEAWPLEKLGRDERLGVLRKARA
jgi:predicted O-methyltransferase YrrM